jgi:peptide/nickel transport system ATP-binding protein
MSHLLEVYSLKKSFPVARPGGLPGKAQVKAVDDVSLFIDRGETLAVVGESGCGKSTLGRLILRLLEPTSGEVWLDGWRVDRMAPGELRRLRRRMQVVFQDPVSSFNPRLRVRDIIAEPLVNFGLAKTRSEIDDQVAELLVKVHLAADSMWRLPHEFSGGQRQRIGVARALAAKPDLIVCDEAVSALDVSSKAQIVNLLADLQDELGMALLFISHDLAVVEHLTHRVAVMYLGALVEVADRDSLFSTPGHPYTRALLSSVLDPDPARGGGRIALRGETPSPIDPPSGCRFHTRCPYAFDRCLVETPVLTERGATQQVACHLPSLPPIS